jgi:hypothetical protein
MCKPFYFPYFTADRIQSYRIFPQAHLEKLGVGSANTIRGLLTISAFKPYGDDFPEISPVFFTNLTRVCQVSQPLQCHST